ncbi:MAG: hypothetical protein JNL01_03900 [Bdellovibrionales bacterium]|nr:hypothetical protein [Bdellovibrionales bacterium]
MNFVFTALAQNQVEFFIGVGQKLKAAGHGVFLISFHERSFPLVQKSGLTGFNVFQAVRELRPKAFSEICTEYGVSNPMDLVIHEMFGFEVSDIQGLENKFSSYVGALESIFDKISQAVKSSPSGSETVVIQETGGFTSLLSTFLVSKKRGFSHYFVEPSFFRGTVFFTKNSVFAPKVSGLSPNPVSEAVNLYLDQTLKSRAIVIPAKDSWQYAGVFGKLLKIRNAVRLFQKLADKYLFDLREEFSYIGAYFMRHARMIVNRIAFAASYTGIPKEPFIYYPLHVPMDVALTVRSPDYLDQYATLDFLLRHLPSGYVLAIKEHPALVGAIDRARMKDLLKRYKRLRFLNPSNNNFDVLGRAELVVTVNSKAGAEAVLMGKPVIVLGDAFYRDSPCVTFAPSLKELSALLQKRVWKVSPENDRRKYFQAVWENSRPGELYLNNDSNFGSFADSILDAVGVTHAKK